MPRQTHGDACSCTLILRSRVERAMADNGKSTATCNGEISVYVYKHSTLDKVKEDLEMAEMQAPG